MAGWYISSSLSTFRFHAWSLSHPNATYVRTKSTAYQLPTYPPFGTGTSSFLSAPYPPPSEFGPLLPTMPTSNMDSTIASRAKSKSTVINQPDPNQSIELEGASLDNENQGLRIEPETWAGHEERPNMIHEQSYATRVRGKRARLTAVINGALRDSIGSDASGSKRTHATELDIAADLIE